MSAPKTGAPRAQGFPWAKQAVFDPDRPIQYRIDNIIQAISEQVLRRVANHFNAGYPGSNILLRINLGFPPLAE